jgi:hypothetical protein
MTNKKVSELTSNEDKPFSEHMHVPTRMPSKSILSSTEKDYKDSSDNALSTWHINQNSDGIQDSDAEEMEEYVFQKNKFLRQIRQANVQKFRQQYPKFVNFSYSEILKIFKLYREHETRQFTN